MRHQDRMKALRRYAMPKLNEEQFAKMREHARRIGLEVSEKDVMRMFERAMLRHDLQMANGLARPNSEALREFLSEYTNRAVNHGLWSMPTSFSVLEAFFQYDPELLTFSLRSEEEHCLPFSKFLDDYTSVNDLDNVGAVRENLPEGVVHTYHNTENPKALSFDLGNGESLCIEGISMVRHGPEVAVMICTGISGLPSITEMNIDRGAGFKEGIEPDQTVSLRRVPVEGTEDFNRSIIAFRLDIESEEVQVRFVGEDIGQSYIVHCDNPETLIDPRTLEPINDFKEAFEASVSWLQERSVIFEIGIALVNLPTYFKLRIDEITEVDEETALAQATLLYRRDSKKVWPEHVVKSRPIQSIIDTSSNLSESLILKTLIVEKSGFYQTIDPHKYGLDKQGNPIQGKTWVNKHLAWNEITEDEFKQSKDVLIKPVDVEGYVYVMASPSHKEDVYKVGFTTTSPHERAKQVTRGSGVPDRLRVVYSQACANPRRVEKCVHQDLRSYRLNSRREYFVCELERIVGSINKCVENTAG